jgi:hypothetical protein
VTPPTVPTTPIPGTAASTSVPAGTLPAPPPNTNTTASPAPRSDPTAPPASASAPGPATTAPAAAPETTAPPATSPPDGDPASFCPAVEQLIPLFYVITIGSLQSSVTAAAYEVAVAPALSRPLDAAASSAPAAVAAPFKAWADRTALALAAFKAAGASDSLTTSFGQSYAAQIDAVTSKGGTQSPPDPVNAAVRAGLDRNRLSSSAAAFQAANGPFDAFAAAFGQHVTLAPADEQALEQRFPCAADLANFTT